MRGSIEIQGTEELMAELRKRFGNAATRLENKGLRAAGKPIADAQKSIVDRSSKSGPHIEDDIRVSGVRRDKLAGTRYILIGGTKLTKWRHHFLEYGTSSMPPEPFISGGFEQGKNEALRILIDNFRRGLEQK